MFDLKYLVIEDNYNIGEKEKIKCGKQKGITKNNCKKKSDVEILKPNILTQPGLMRGEKREIVPPPGMIQLLFTVLILFR